MFLVKYKYASSQPDELSLKVGDIITHVSDCEPGWATGKINGKEGLYPTNFVVPWDSSMSTSKSEKLDRKNDEAKGDSKKSKSRSSDQHKRDSKTEPSDDEIDGGGYPASSSNLSLDVNSSSHETKSQSSVDDALDSTQSSAGKPGGSIIKSVAKKAQKVLPSTSHTKSHSHDVTGGSGVKSSKTTRDRSGGVVDYSPNTTAAGAGGSRNWQGFKKGSRVNKSMDSLNSVEDEHENVSRGSKSSSTEMLSDTGLAVANNGLTSPECDISPTFPDTLFGSEIEIGETIPTTAVKKDIPRQNKKRPPTREKIRQDAEKAETDRAAAAESTLVQIQKPSPTEGHGRLKVGAPLGPGGAVNRFGGAPMPGMGANFLSELKNKQNKKDPAEHKQLSSPQNSVIVNNHSNNSNSHSSAEVTSSLNNRASISSGHGVTVSSAATSSKPEHRPISTGASPSTVGEARRLFGGGAAPTNSNPHLSDNHSPLKSSTNQSATPPVRPQKPITGVKPSVVTRPLSSVEKTSTDSPTMVSSTPSTAAAINTPPVVANKPSRPPPPQVPDKPRAIAESGAASMSSIALKQSRTEVEMRTLKDTVTRLERRIKDVEAQLEDERDARVKLESKVDALLKK